jgi:biofilm PGA synthesis lipoprotein PgaB
MRPRRALPWLGLVLLLWLLVTPASAAERLRAAQVSYLSCRNHPQVAAEFARMRRLGLDTVIVRVFHRPGDRYYGFARPQAPSGVYFTTDAAPVVDDVLGSLVTLGHAAGLKVFAWMTTLSTPLAEGQRWRGRRFDLENGRVVPCAALDPFRPEVRQRLVELFADLARYDLDGILLQDDLVLRHTEGFSTAALGTCLRDTGRLPNPDELFAERTRTAAGAVRVRRYGPFFEDWARWKNRRLLDLAGTLRRAALAVNGELKFVLNLPYEVLTAPQQGLAWFAQDFSAALKTDFDYLAVMAYHRQMASELAMPVPQAIGRLQHLAAAGAARLVCPARLMVKLQTLDFDDSRALPATEMAQVVRAAERAGPVSLAFFPYRASLRWSPRALACNP